MKFETKYNIGDTVYFMKGNRIQEGHIKDIIYTYNGIPNERYCIKEDHICYPQYHVTSLFSTKEELISTLLNN